AGRLVPVKFGEGVWESADADRANGFYGQMAGLKLNPAREKVVALLQQEGCIGKPSLPLTHAVKFYEKGSRPLEIIPTRQWFIKILPYKEDLLQQGKKIQWHPEHMFEKYRSWVEVLNQDWCISRQRYFGVPFPVWYPLDAEGRPDLSRPVVPDEKSLPVDPFVDTPPGYQESQRNQPGGFAPEDFVFDTWATSSLSPQLCSGWRLPPNPDKHDKLFPMDVRPQSHEIIRTW